MTIYEPREDTFLLAEQVKKHAFGKVLDMGTGSGYLAEAASSSRKVKSVLAADVNGEVVNFLKNKIKKENIKKIKPRKSDLFSNVKESFDTIIFNPPYLPLDTREPEDSRLTTTGGKKGHEVLQRFLLDLNSHLTKNGIALILFSSLTRKNKIDEIIDSIGYDFELLKEEKFGLETLYVYKLKRNWLLNELLKKKITHIRKLTKGHRGVIFRGELNKKLVAIKAQRLDIRVRTIEREADMVKKLNKKGLAPKLLFKGKNYFIYEYVPGELIVDFLKHSNKTETKKVLLEVLMQCRVLDKMKISKKEMTNPYKHVIISKKIALIDFERAHYSPNPGNVTQFCQYIMRNHDLLSRKGIKFNKNELIFLAKEYKNNQTGSNYKKIRSFVLAF